MRFSVIIPSFLGEYQYAAKDREKKLIRAVDSVIAGTFDDYEIMVVADGCEKTYELIERFYKDNLKVDCVLIQKQKLWSGKPRQEGIKRSKGEYIVYLDADDKWGENHLSIINHELIEHRHPDWVWFNDKILDKTGRLIERHILINQRFQNGTSNICHKRSLAVEWNGVANQYGTDDGNLVQQLLRYNNKVKIRTPEYYVCHLPQKLDV